MRSWNTVFNSVAPDSLSARKMLDQKTQNSTSNTLGCKDECWRWKHSQVPTFSCGGQWQWSSLGAGRKCPYSVAEQWSLVSSLWNLLEEVTNEAEKTSHPCKCCLVTEQEDIFLASSKAKDWPEIFRAPLPGCMCQGWKIYFSITNDFLFDQLNFVLQNRLDS